MGGEKRRRAYVVVRMGGGGVVHSLVRFCPPCIEMRRRENTRVPGAGGTSKEGGKERGKLPKMKYCGAGRKGREGGVMYFAPKGEGGGEAKIIIELLANDLSSLSSFLRKKEQAQDRLQKPRR